jgi:hypothetical protein
MGYHSHICVLPLLIDRVQSTNASFVIQVESHVKELYFDL